MAKIYVVVSALILLAVLLFGPLLSLNSSAQMTAVSWNTTPALIEGWTAGPFEWD